MALKLCYYSGLWRVLSRNRGVPGRLFAVAERRWGSGDTPLARADWERDYSRGGWDFLRGLGELGHVAIVAAYAARLKPGGSVLDVGCGEGALFHLLRPHGPSRYLGIDLSQAALSRLQALPGGAIAFEQADAELFESAERFDVICFVESLYYLRDPLAAFGRYACLLAPGGILILSTYQGAPRASAVLRLLKRHHPPMDETRVHHGGKAWRCTVFKPERDLRGGV